MEGVVEKSKIILLSLMILRMVLNLEKMPKIIFGKFKDVKIHP